MPNDLVDDEGKERLGEFRVEPRVLSQPPKAFDLLLMLVQVGSVPHEKVIQTIELLAKYVLPKMRSGAAKVAAA